MIWEPTLPVLSAVIIGIVALIYGIMRWEFVRTALFMLVLLILIIAALILIYGVVAWGLTGKVFPNTAPEKQGLLTIIAAIIAAIPGIVVFLLRVLDYHRSYLHITLRVDLNENGFLSAMTEVENKGISRKKLRNALLLVGPEDEDPIDDTMREIGFDVQYTDDIVKLKICNAIPGPQGRALIPLPFFYSENVRIADEKVSYRAQINTHYIPRGVPYSVRFFIRAPWRLHRTTHDSFVLPLPAP